MKKNLLKLVALSVIPCSTVAFADVQKPISINDTVIENAYIQNVEGTEHLPLRAVCENLGFTVNWINETRTIEIVKMPVFITCSPDYDGYTFSKTAPMPLGTTPLLINDTTYVPLNFADEIINYKYSNNDDMFTIIDKDPILKTGEVCELVYEDEKLVAVVIGDAEDPLSQTVLKFSEEVAADVVALGIEVGSKIVAEVSDMQTMSLPPQVTAYSISLSEEVEEVEETSDTVETKGEVCELVYEDEKLVAVVIGDAEDPLSQTVLNVSEEVAADVAELEIEVGTKITAEVSATATKSIPAQVTAYAINLDTEAETVEAKGEVCELVYEDEKLVAIVIGDAEDPLSQTALNISEELAADIAELEIEVGTKITAEVSATATKSIPPQVTAYAIAVDDEAADAE